MNRLCEGDAIALAARNNAEWCDAVARSWGTRGAFHDGFWINRDEAPPFYPNAVTLAEDATDLLAVLDAIVAENPLRAFAVKDSFRCLDLAPLGFAPLFDTEWVWLEPSQRPELRTDGISWRSIRDGDGLAAWERAWRGEDTATAPLFRPALLESGAHVFVAAEQRGRIVAGCVASRSAGAVGVSNFFPDDPALRAGAVAAAMDRAPGLPVVGYEGDAALEALKSLGFQSVGALRVWVRNAG